MFFFIYIYEKKMVTFYKILMEISVFAVCVNFICLDILPFATGRLNCKCKFHCRSIPHTQKKLLFHNFYALKDNCKQNSYLMRLMIIPPVKRRRHGKYDDPKDSKRKVTVCFSMPDGTGNIIQACKKLFMDVFGITKRRVETLVLKKKKLYTETRGNTQNRSKFTDADKNLIIEHVNSFPRDKSHNGRKKAKKNI
jgi:hypothetical protein